MDWAWLPDFRWLKGQDLLLLEVIATVLVLVLAFVLRAALLRMVKRISWADEAMRARWRMQVRRTLVAVTVLCLFFIWGSELRTLALSLVAVAVALVIATKELILCVMGAVMRASSKSFTVGDRIEVGGVRGDVIDAGIFATQLLETGPAHHRTGRAIIVPNSTFLVSPAINETFTDRGVVLHVVTVPLELGDDWQRAEAALLDAARRVTAEYKEAARDSLTSMAQNHHLGDDVATSMAEPQVLVSFPEAGQLSLSVRVPTPVREKGTIEQRIVRRYLELMAAKRSAERQPVQPVFAHSP